MTNVDRKLSPAVILSRVLALTRKAIAYEWGMWQNLYRWVFRRPVTSDPEATAFGYTSLVMPVLLAFIGVSAVEIPILHLLLPWESVRLIADAAGVYSLLWMIGLLASLRVRPHVLSDAGLRVRYGVSVDARIPWDAVASIRKQGRDLPGRTVQVERTESGTILQIGIMKQTNIDVVLRRPLPVPLAKLDGAPVAELRFYADDPDALVRHARIHLTTLADTADVDTAR